MMPPTKIFQDLIVWQKAHAFIRCVYGFSKGFPKDELYGLTSQLRRVAVSIPANIAKGLLEEVSRLLNADTQSIPTPNSQLLHSDS